MQPICNGLWEGLTEELQLQLINMQGSINAGHVWIMGGHKNSGFPSVISKMMLNNNERQRNAGLPASSQAVRVTMVMVVVMMMMMMMTNEMPASCHALPPADLCIKQSR